MADSVLTKQNRLLWADLIRIVGALMVVLIHTAAPLFHLYGENTAAYVAGGIFSSLGHAGVPLFVMASGVFLLDPRREVTAKKACLRYALPIAVLYVVWSFLYALANKVAEPVLLQHTAVSAGMIREFAVAWVEGAYHLWYLPMTAGLYLITPLLRTLTENKTALKLFLVLAGVFAFAVPTALHILETVAGDTFGFAALYNNFYLTEALGYPAYFVAGYAIANHKPTPGQKRWVFSLGALSLVLMAALTFLLSAVRGEEDSALLEPLTLFNALYGVGMFALFAWCGKSTASREKTAAAVTGLTKLTFGVYVIHVEVQALFKVFLPYTGQNPVGYILLQWVAVTAISLAVSWVISKIPGVKKLIRG